MTSMQPDIPIERVVFSGGGAKGILYSGAYHALIKAGLFKNIKAISGASAGALTAALMAIGMPSELFRKNLQETNLGTLLGSHTDSFFSPNAPGVSFLTKDGKPLEEFIRKLINNTIKDNLEKLKDQDLANSDRDFQRVLAKTKDTPPLITFADLAVLNRLFPEQFKQLTMTAVRLPDGTVQVFNSELTPDVEIALACRASASIPVVLEPVTININGEEQQFVDGGLFDNLPTDFFEHQLNGPIIPNEKPEQTLVFAFGEGLEDHKNPVFNALYGSRKDEVEPTENKPVLYNPGFIERLKRDVAVELLGDLEAPYKNTEQKEKGYQKLRSEYPLRTVELRAGEIKTTDFNKATQTARVMDALGYLDTINYLTNHELHDPSCLDSEAFFTELVDNFKIIIEATLASKGKPLLNHPLIKEMDELNNQLRKQDPDISEARINRQLFYLIKDWAERKPDSTEASMLTRALELQQKSLTSEQLFKELYEERFKSSGLFSLSKITGETIFRSATLHESLKKKNMFELYASQPQPRKETRTDVIFNILNQIPSFKNDYETWLKNKPLTVKNEEPFSPPQRAP